MQRHKRSSPEEPSLLDPRSGWDVLPQPAPPSDGLGPMVVGFDGSPGSADSLSFAAGLARRNRSPLTIVYVVPPAYLSNVHPIAGGVLVDAALAAASSVERQAISCLSGVDVRWSFLRCVGDIAIEIERAAEALRADLIVVGQSDHHWRRRSRSVAARLVRRAHRPVIVVP